MKSAETGGWLDHYWAEKRRHFDGRRERTRRAEAELNGASRSELVFGAAKAEPNRYRLARITMRVARSFHVQSERMETSISGALRQIGNARGHASPPREKPAVSADEHGAEAA